MQRANGPPTEEFLNEYLYSLEFKIKSSRHKTSGHPPQNKPISNPRSPMQETIKPTMKWIHADTPKSTPLSEVEDI